MFYPVEYDPKLRIFNNQVDFYEFLAESNPEINVGLSALLPPTEFVVGEKHFPCRTIVDFFEQIAEQTGLPIDTKASTIRMGVILLFLTENLEPDPEPEPEPDPEPEPPVEGDGETTASVASQNAEPAIMTMSMEEAAPDNVDAILQQAAALEDEADKSGSKVALEAFAKQYGVSLARNKTFANMMKDFEAALRA